MSETKHRLDGAPGADPASFMDDPNWADFLPDVPSGGPKCRLPAHEDCTPLDVERLAARADDVFDHPLDWPAPEALLRGDEARPWDAGNVNAVAMGGKHFLTYYSGNETNTTVYVAPAPLAE